MTDTPTDRAALEALAAKLERASEDVTSPLAAAAMESAATLRALAARAEPPADVAISRAAQDVIAERQGQITREGWTPEHDDKHDAGEMAKAAASYVLHEFDATEYEWSAMQHSHYPRYGDDGRPIFDIPVQVPVSWPWGAEWWKPKGRRRDLVRAAALIIAEIERLDRNGDGHE